MRDKMKIFLFFISKFGRFFVSLLEITVFVAFLFCMCENALLRAKNEEKNRVVKVRSHHVVFKCRPSLCSSSNPFSSFDIYSVFLVLPSHIFPIDHLLCPLYHRFLLFPRSIVTTFRRVANIQAITYSNFRVICV